MTEEIPVPDPATGPRPPRRLRRALAVGGSALIVVAGVGLGAAASHAGTSTTASTEGLGAAPSWGGGTWDGPGSSQRGGSGGASGDADDSFGGSSRTTGSGSAATAEQTVGVVTIVTTLGYRSAQAAGTGVILTSDGEILTNDHVVDGATEIRVTVESSGRTYTARVVGTDSAEDVAVLRLAGASGLTPATIADGDVSIGDAVTAVGNAGGTGTLTAADGVVTDTGRTITTQSEDGEQGETLHGLIETDADVVSGDSGGPLVDAAGAVVGIDTAASSGGDPTGYAIPIADALDTAARILQGDESDGITIGYPAFLGVTLADDPSVDGATVAGAIEGTPAAQAGLGAGDVITAVGGTAVGSAGDLSAAVSAREPGERVTIAYTDASGADRTATVTLTEGPAD